MRNYNIHYITIVLSTPIDTFKRSGIRKNGTQVQISYEKYHDYHLRDFIV